MKKGLYATFQAKDKQAIKIYAINKQSGSRTEITDMYWFEENYVHSLTGNIAWDFEIEVRL